ncbi:hypothetical protein BGX34_005052, partial [Mortierella sp. NVP85]
MELILTKAFGAQRSGAIYTIDFECEATRQLFTEEWVEIKGQELFVLPMLPTTVVRYLLKVQQAFNDQEPVVNVPLPTEERDSCELILDSFRVWERMYRKVPSPFVVQDLSEAYWGRKSWPLLMELLEDHAIASFHEHPRLHLHR